MKRIISALLIAVMLCSMAAMSASAAVIKTEEFDDLESVAVWLYPGNAYTEDGLLIGDASARAMQGIAVDQDPDGEWMTGGEGTFPAKCDVQWVLKSELDDTQDGTNRNWSFAYHSDGPVPDGGSTLTLRFTYNWTDGKFYLCNEVNNDPGAEGTNAMEPVEKEIVADGEFFKMGMSVEDNRVRFFYNDELIFDYQGTEEQKIGTLPSLIFTWNTQCIYSIDKLVVTDTYDLYPATAAGDNGGDNGGDVTPPPAEGGDDTVAPPTGDATFVVIVAMAIALGSAIIVKKVSAR